jgi:predicted nucleotidyltransferase
MKKLSNEDYLLEINLRVAVRKQDVIKLISQAERRKEDKTEEDRVLSAVIDIVDDAFASHCDLLENPALCAKRIPKIKEFEDFGTLGEHSHTKKAPKDQEEFESPLTKKRNKGKKIILDTADRLFAGFQERLNRLTDHGEFGVSVPLVLLFGSYLRREPEVGDIDFAVMTIDNSNYELRKKQIDKVRRSSVSFIEELIGPKKEVLQFLKNRSAWFALHDFSEVLALKNLSFKAVHYSPEFEPLVESLNQKELSGEEFLKAAENLRMKMHTLSK